MQDQMNNLKQLNPLQDEYKIKLKECDMALSKYMSRVKESATYAQQQEVAIEKQYLTVEKLQNSFNRTNNRYSVDANSSKQSQEIQSMINSLLELNPLEDKYKIKLKEVGMALGEYNNQVKDNLNH